MRLRRYICYFLIMMACFLKVAHCPSAGAADQDFLDLCVKDGAQIYPEVIWNPDGKEYLVVWFDQENKGIYGLRLEADGDKKGNDQKIASIKATDGAILSSIAPKICYSSEKKIYLVTWHDQENTQTGQDIFASLVTLDGDDKIASTSIAIPKFKEVQNLPKAAWNGEQFLMVWVDFRNGQATDTQEQADIYGVRIDPNGLIVDEESIEICTAELGQIDPAVIGFNHSNEKGWLVAWTDGRNPSNDTDIYAAKIKVDENNLNQQIIQICVEPKDQNKVCLAEGPKGFIVAWRDSRLKGVQQFGTTSKNVIYGLRLSSKFEVYPMLMQISPTDLSDVTPSIDFLKENFFIAWDQQGDIYGTRVSWEGDPLDIKIQDNQIVRSPVLFSDPNTISQIPSVAVNDTDGTIFMTWITAEESALQDKNIFGFLYSPPEPPKLNWVGSTDYKKDGVDPDEGQGGDEFTFQVKYQKSTDVIDGSDDPIFNYLIVDYNRNGSIDNNNEAVIMSQISSDDEEDEHLYEIKVTILYDGEANDSDGYQIPYQFYFRDESNKADGDPSTEHYFTITPKDDVPILSWEGSAGFVQDGLNPDYIRVDEEESFSFLVKYTDQDKDAPGTKEVWIDIDRDNSFNEQNEKFEMTKESGSDYNKGVTYSFEKEMIFTKAGLIPYRFYFNDESNIAQGEPKNIHYLVITNTSETGIYCGPKPQINPQIVLTTKGGMLVWEDWRKAEYEDPNLGQYVRDVGIYGLFLDPNTGEPLRQEPNYGEIELGRASRDKFNPRLAGRDKIFLAVWEDLRNGEIVTTSQSSGYWNKDIYGQLIDLADPNRKMEVGIAKYNCSTPENKNQVNPAVAAGEGNKFLVVWEDHMNIYGGTSDIYATLVSYDPTVHSVTVHQDPNSYNNENNYVINDFFADDDGDQSHPVAAWVEQANKYLVVWEDNRPEKDNDENSHLYANPIDPNGRVTTSGANSIEKNQLEGNPLCIDPNTNQYFPDLASDGQNFLVVFEHEIEGTNVSGKNIYGLFVDSNCQKIGSKFPICNANGDQSRPRVCWDEGLDRYLVTWEVPVVEQNNQGLYFGGSDIDIHGIWVKADGELIGGSATSGGFELAALTGAQTKPAVAANGLVTTLVFSDSRHSGSPLIPEFFPIQDEYDLFSIPIISMLESVDEEGFSNGVKKPSSGGNGKNYVFKINYLNTTNQDPNTSQVWVDLNGDGQYSSSEKYDMQIDPNDEEPDNGQVYKASVTLTIPEDYQGNGSLGYRFYFENENDYPSTGSGNIQNEVNLNPPWLIWTQEPNYTAEGVYPTSGNKNTTFNFRVMYIYVNTSDPEAEQIGPDFAHICIDLNENGIYEADSEKFSLNEADPNNKEYNKGKIYTYNYKGNKDGTFRYKFSFEHRYGGPAIGLAARERQFIISTDGGGTTPGERNWTTFTSPEILSNQITCLAVLENTLWVGTQSGINTYKGKTWAAITPGTEPNLAGSAINSMAVDSINKVIYIGTGSGLSSYDGTTWKKYNKEQTDNVLGLNNILALAYDKTHHDLWIALSEQATYDANAPVGLIRYDISNKAWFNYNKSNTSNDEGGGLPSNSIISITVDSNGDLWVATYIPGVDKEGTDNDVQAQGKGMSCFKVEEREWSNFTTSSSNNQDSLLKTDIFLKLNGQTSDTIWVSGLAVLQGSDTGGGLYQFDISSSRWVNRFYKGKSGVLLGSDSIRALCVDGADLWIGTVPSSQEATDGGASLYSGNTWKIYTTTSTNNGLASNAISAIAVQGDEIWFGTYDKGLSRYGYGDSNSTVEEKESPMDPNRAFFFPSKTGCFTESFGKIDYQKKRPTIPYWLRTFLMAMSIIGGGMIFFFILGRCIWVKR